MRLRRKKFKCRYRGKKIVVGVSARYPDKFFWEAGGYVEWATTPEEALDSAKQQIDKALAAQDSLKSLDNLEC